MSPNFCDRRGQLLSSTDNNSFFKNLADYGRSLTSSRGVAEVIKKARSIK